MMDTVNCVKNEFYRWILSLKENSLSDFDKTFINLIMNNFDSIEETYKSDDKRAEYLGQLIEKLDRETDKELIKWEQEQRDNSTIADKIGKIKMKGLNESGFEDQISFEEKFSFVCDSKTEPIFGALKSVLLGAHEKAAVVGKDIEGYAIPVTSNPEAYRCCFIEKKGIEEFADLSVVTAKTHIDRLAVLLGFQMFNDFVNGFTDNFGDKYLILSNAEEEKIKEELLSMESKKEKLKTIEVRIKEENKKAEELVKLINNPKIKKYEDVKVYLSGKDGKGGRIEELSKKEFNVSDDLETDIFDHIEQTVTEIKGISKIVKGKSEEFKNSLIQLNYHKLYLTIREIGFSEEMEGNPLEENKEEIEKLEKVAGLQNGIESDYEKILQLVDGYNELISKLNQIFKVLDKKDTTASKISKVTYPGINSVSESLDKLEEEVVGCIDLLEKKGEYLKVINKYNEGLKKNREEKLSGEEELKKYEKIQAGQSEIEEALKGLNEEKEVLTGEISKMNQYDGKVTEEMEALGEKVEFNNNMKTAYDNLIPQLKAYRDNLIIKETRNLSRKAIEYYNMVNGYGSFFEKLDELILPLTPNEKIIIRFSGETKEYEAFQVLSEGNMKVLGLAILLSKLINKRRNFIILDDITDFIGDALTDGIFELMLKCNDLSKRQIIIICKDDIMVDKLEQKLEATMRRLKIETRRF